MTPFGSEPDVGVRLQEVPHHHRPDPRHRRCTRVAIDLEKVEDFSKIASYGVVLLSA
jgi:hypothetical protein